MTRTIEFVYADTETYSRTDPKFWYGDLKIKGVHNIFYNFESFFAEMLTVKKGVQRVVVFHNAKYDVSIMQYHARYQLGYDIDPKESGKSGAFYISGMQTEIYPMNRKTGKTLPIMVVDSKNIIQGSIRAWGDKLGFPKGDTPLVDEWQEPTTKDLDYLKRDVDIMNQACDLMRCEDNWRKGLLTASSIAQGSLKERKADITGGSYKVMGLRKRFDKAVETKPMKHVPRALHALLEREEHIFKSELVQRDPDTGMMLYKVDEKVVKLYIQKLRAFYMQAYNKIPNFRKMDTDSEDYLNLPLPPVSRPPKRENYAHMETQRRLLAQVNEQNQSAMRGGISYVNPRYRGVLLGRGTTIDRNSMYPAVLLQYEIPYTFAGLTSDEIDLEMGKYFMVQVKRLKAKVKDGVHPFLKRSTKFTSDTAYKREIDWTGDFKNGSWDTVLTSVDVNHMYKVYDVEEFEVRKVFYYVPDDAFTKAIREHIKYWAYQKEHAETKQDRQYAKMQLNTLWGRWGMVHKMVDNAGKKEDVGDPYTNLVSACFVTSYARVDLNKMINRFYDEFVYCDTDSVHMIFSKRFPNKKAIENELGDLLDDDIVGKWKMEHSFDRAKYVQPKTYIHELDGKLESTTAGADVNFERLEDFRIGMTIPTKKSYKLDDGRIVIQETTFTLGGNIPNNVVDELLLE